MATSRPGSVRALIFGALVALTALPAGAAPPAPALAGLDALYPSLDALYRELHRAPELSLQEEKTAARMAAQLRALGFEVTERVGGHGVVGVLRNGKGPTVALRTELDALPVKEQTGLPYASTATAVDASGGTVPVMHACGHDVHMASWVGAATLLSRSRERWRGTLVMIGQPAEEVLSGARAMLADGLFTRFPRPDVAVAFHDTNLLPAGQVGVTPGFAFARADNVDVTIFGKGGHGAAPHQTVDPVVIAARTVIALQTIVSREVNPIDPAVITVGSIHGGTKHNIVPDEVKLQLTVRSYKEEVQKHLLAAIERIARAEAVAARAPREPVVTVASGQSVASLFNDPSVTKRLGAALAHAFGAANVVDLPPRMASEDFSELGRAGVPIVQLFVGAVEPGAFAKAKASGTNVPGPHSPLFAPDREPTIRTGTATLTLAALELLGKG